MSLLILAFFLGILSYHFIYQHVWLIVFVGLGGLLSYRLRIVKWWLAFLAGIIWIYAYMGWQHVWILPKQLEGVPVIAVGEIVAIPEKKLSFTHFLFAIEYIEKPYIPIPLQAAKLSNGSCRLQAPYAPNRSHKGLSSATRSAFGSRILKSERYIKLIHKVIIRCAWRNAPQLLAGDKWQLQLILKKLHSTINPGEFDYEAWAFAHGILATGSVNPAYPALKLSTSSFVFSIDRLRQHLAEKIDQVLSHSQTKGLIKALIVGDQSSILKEQWTVLRQTGTNHLFAIAGLHIGFVAHLLYQLCHWFSRHSIWLALRFSAPLVAAIGALASAIIYSALAGFSLPTRRAVIMLTVFLIAKITRRNIGFWHSWFIALGIILVVNPLQILTESFWLSFTAVGSLIYGFYGRINLSTNQLSNRLIHAIKTQWITSVALIPLTLLLFQQASLVSLFANFIAIPAIGFLIAPLSLFSGLLLLSCPAMGSTTLKWANFLLAHFWPVLQQLGSIPNSQWYQAILTPWVLVSAAIALLLLLAPKGFPARWLAGLWLLPLIFYSQQKPEFATADFTLLDVGQGLSAVVRTQQHVLIFDTGAHRKDSFDAGESILLPFLRWFHLQRIDTLMISHGDNDHIGGAQTLLATKPVDRIITSVPERFPHHSVFSCMAGQSWWWDGVKFEVLSPLPGNFLTGNNSSCVLKVSTPLQSVLLTGDIEKEAEKILLATAEKNLAADVLVAPHHGSKTSSTEAFINAVHPRVVLFPVGYRNQYHHPAPMIVSRYREKSVKQYDSVHCGAINIELTLARQLPVHCYREEHERFWRENYSAFWPK